MKIFVLKTSKILVWVGISTFVLGIILFTINSFEFNSEAPINSEIFGAFSNYVGGIVGSLWALAGVILLYVALNDQKEDIENNRKALTTQIDALNNQIKEFELQRKEMRLTRKIFDEQSITLKKQQFESTFFNSLNLFNEIIKEISFTKFEMPALYPIVGVKAFRDGKAETTIYKGRESFFQFYQELKEMYNETNDEFISAKFFGDENALENSINPNTSVAEEADIINKAYKKLFDKYQSQLGHYFRTVYNIIERIDIENSTNPKYYTDLIRAQISTFEHLLLFYNCLSDYGQNFKPLIVKYQLLDNLELKNLLFENHKEHYPDRAYI